jgi:hypothetical protein
VDPGVVDHAKKSEQLEPRTATPRSGPRRCSASFSSRPDDPLCRTSSPSLPPPYRQPGEHRRPSHPEEARPSRRGENHAHLCWPHCSATRRRANHRRLCCRPSSRALRLQVPLPSTARAAARRVELTSRPCPVVMLVHTRPSPSSTRAQIVAGPCFLPSRCQNPAKVVPSGACCCFPPLFAYTLFDTMPEQWQQALRRAKSPPCCPLVCRPS